MPTSREQVLNETIAQLRQLSDDWDYDGEITRDTRFFADLGLESLDIVVLATVAQETYGQALPFPDFFAGVGSRADSDVTVEEWAGFIYSQLQPVVA